MRRARNAVIVVFCGHIFESEIIYSVKLLLGEIVFELIYNCNHFRSDGKSCPSAGFSIGCAAISVQIVFACAGQKFDLVVC